MPAIEVEDRVAVREDRTQPRLLLAHRFKPARDRAKRTTYGYPSRMRLQTEAIEAVRPWQ